MNRAPGPHLSVRSHLNLPLPGVFLTPFLVCPWIFMFNFHHHQYPHAVANFRGSLNTDTLKKEDIVSSLQGADWFPQTKHTKG